MFIGFMGGLPDECRFYILLHQREQLTAACAAPNEAWAGVVERQRIARAQLHRHLIRHISRSIRRRFGRNALENKHITGLLLAELHRPAVRRPIGVAVVLDLAR